MGGAAPPHPFILQNCVYNPPVNSIDLNFNLFNRKIPVLLVVINLEVSNMYGIYVTLCKPHNVYLERNLRLLSTP